MSLPKLVDTLLLPDGRHIRFNFKVAPCAVQLGMSGDIYALLLLIVVSTGPMLLGNFDVW